MTDAIRQRMDSAMALAFAAINDGVQRDDAELTGLANATLCLISDMHFLLGRLSMVDERPPPNPESVRKRRTKPNRTFAGLLDVNDTAAKMGTSVSHIREMIRKGELPHTRVGRFLRVSEEAVDKYIAENSGKGFPHERTIRR